MDSGGGYFANTPAQVTKLCACSTIDYFSVMHCAKCNKTSFAACKLTTITSKSPGFGVSLHVRDNPLITSIAGLGKRLSGILQGALWVGDNPKLTSLDGLESIEGLGADRFGQNVYLFGNSGLVSATALETCSANYSSGKLSVESNPHLACVPSAWPEKDALNYTIRNGKPKQCLWSCDSDLGKCALYSTGNQSQQACDKVCNPKPGLQTAALPALGNASTVP